MCLQHTVFKGNIRLKYSLIKQILSVMLLFFFSVVYVVLDYFCSWCCTLKMCVKVSLLTLHLMPLKQMEGEFLEVQHHEKLEC